MGGGGIIGTLIGAAAFVFMGPAAFSWLAVAKTFAVMVVLGAVAKATAKRPAAGGGATMSAQGRMETVRQPLGPWQVVYGRCRIGGTLTYFEVSTDKQTAHMIVTYTGHAAQNIRDIYFNDASTVDYGAVGAATAAAGRFAGFSTVNRSAGTEGAAQPFAALVSAGLSWAATDLQRNRAKVYSSHTFSNEVWQTGLPMESAIIEGVKDIYDPRVGSPGTNRWSNNPALCLAHYLTATYGLGATYATELDEAQLIVAANICDERVTLSGSLTSAVSSISAVGNTITLAANAQHVDWGDGVRFTTTGTLPAEITAGVTYYAEATWEGDATNGQILRLATSYASLMAGGLIDLTTAGSGTITMTFYDEPRYRLNGAFALSEKPQAVIERMLVAMAGTLIQSGGVWYVYAGAYTAPTLTLDEDDFASGMQIQTNLSRRDNANAVKGSFTDPSSRYQPIDFPPFVSQTYFQEDGGERVWRDLDLTAFVMSATQAQRLAKIDLINTRVGLTVQARFKLSAFRMMTGATVAITHAQMGWTAKVFEVANCTMIIEQDGRLEVDALLKETAAAIYDWSVSDEQLATLSPNTNLPDATAIAVPTAFAFVQSSSVPDRGEFSWVAPVDAFINDYQVEWANSGSPTTWVAEPKVKGLSTIIDGLAIGAYQFRIRAFNMFGAASSYVYISGSMTTPTVANVTGLVIYGTSGSPTVTEFIGKDATVQWDHVASGTAGYFFKDYEVSVYRSGSPTELLRTEYTSDPWYTYSFEKNYKDTNSVPARSLRFEVKRRGIYNQLSSVVALLEASNTVPTVSAFTLTAGAESFKFSYTPPADPDFIGLRVYASLTTGFTPSSTNLFYEGSKKNGVVGPLIGGMKYYVKYVPVDSFGDGATSSEGSVTTSRPVGAVLSADLSLGSLYAFATLNLNTAYGWTWASAPIYVPSTGLIYCFGVLYPSLVMEVAAFNARTLELVKRSTISLTFAPLAESFGAGPVYSPDTGMIYIAIYDTLTPGGCIAAIDPTTLTKVSEFSTSSRYLRQGNYCSGNGKIYYVRHDFAEISPSHQIAAFNPTGSPTELVVTTTTPSNNLGGGSPILYIPTIDRLVIADDKYIYFLGTNMAPGSPTERIDLTNIVYTMAYCSKNDRIYANHLSASYGTKVVSTALALVTTINGGALGILSYSPQNGALYALGSSTTAVISTETNSYAGTLAGLAAESVPAYVTDMWSIAVVSAGPILKLRSL